MDLDIQPLDIQPLDDDLDIQALDIQPLDAPKKERSTGEMSLGLLEAGASMVAGLPSMIAGGLGGLGQLVSGKGLDAAAQMNERIQESNFGMGKYKPSTEAGQAYSEKLGTAMNKPVEWAGDAGEAIGGNLGRANAEVAVGTLMNFLPLPIGLKGIKGSAGAFQGRGKPKVNAAKADKLEALLDVKEAKGKFEQAAVGEQLDLLPRVEIKGTSADLGPQFDPTYPMPEARGSMANKRQMGFDFGEGRPDQFNVDRVGEAVRSDVNPNDLVGREAATQKVSAELDAQARAQRLQEQPPRVSDDMRGQAELDLQNPTPYTPIDAKWTVDENGMPIRQDLSVEAQTNANLPQRDMFDDVGGTPPRDTPPSIHDPVDPLPPGPVKSIADEFEGLMGSTRVADMQYKLARAEDNLAWVLQDTKEVMTNPEYASIRPEAMRDIAEAQSRVDQLKAIEPELQRRDYADQIEGIERGMMIGARDELKAAVQKGEISREEAQALVQRAHSTGTGMGVAAIIEDAIDNPNRAAMESHKKQLEQQQQIEEYTPGTPSFNTRTRKQGGGILIGGGKKNALEKMNKLPGLRQSLSNFLPDTLTTQEFVERHANTADIQQNIIQKGFNFGTKGGDYMVEKTGNPLIKRVVDTFKGADGRAKAAIQTIVHENYAAKLRGLSKDEFVEAWQALKAMEARGSKLSTTELIELGYTAKQRDLIATHQSIMDSMVPKWEQAMSDAGMGHFKPEVAYVASKATGQFRKLIYKKGADGELSVAGIVGADTRAGLNKQVSAYQKLHPEYEAGPEQTFMGGGKGRMADGFEEMLHMLSNSDPTVAEFVARSKEMLNSEVQNYRGAKSHTMQKKGIEGMAGNKPWEDAYTNAKDGFDAQVAYLNRGLEFAEKAAAVKEIQPLLSPDSGLKMPNATAYAKDYMDMALGRNPMQIGRAVDEMFNSMGRASGIGTSIPGKGVSAVRHLVNTKLLSLNPGFLLANAVEIFRSTPEMAAYLRQRGVDTGITGLRYNAEALMDMAKEQAGQKLSPVIEGALKYANDNHVYASDLFEKSNDTRRGRGGAVVEGLQKPAAFLEHHTRKNSFLGYVRMLNDNGIGPKDGLYEAATKLTDMAMNSYSKMESPMGLQALGGGISGTAYNLMSYKFNQLSRFAMMARDLPNKGSLTPVLTSLVMQATFGGLMGTMYYKEADWLVKVISEAMGKPTSITKMLLDNDKKVEVPLIGKIGTPELAYGGFGAVGLDMTNRLGAGYVTGDLSKPLDLAMPGAGALVDAGGAAIDLAKNPNKFNAMKAAVDILPGGSLLDRHFFSKTMPDGTELASSRRKEGEATAKRNDADKMWKNFGMTGSNESMQKTTLFENQRIDKVYQEKQKQAVANMAKSFYTSGKVDKASVDAYIKAQGNPDSLTTAIENMAMEQNIDAPTRDAIKASAQSTIGGARKMQRRFQ